MDGDRMEKKVNIIYGENFKTKYINGAFGGFNGKGDFVINLFYENIILPSGSSLRISEDNQVQEMFDPKDDIDRCVEASVVMSLETAKSIRDWLSLNIEQREKEINK